MNVDMEQPSHLMQRPEGSFLVVLYSSLIRCWPGVEAMQFCEAGMGMKLNLNRFQFFIILMRKSTLIMALML